MNYIYTPNDIAIFLLKTNFQLSYELIILSALWEEQKHISKKYRQDKSAFIRAVRLEMASYTIKDNMEELDLIMRDVDPNYILLTPDDEHDFILRFFKVIRLELLYIKNKDHYKIGE